MSDSSSPCLPGVLEQFSQGTPGATRRRCARRRCEVCPSAFCEDHLPGEADLTVHCARFQALGQAQPKQVPPPPPPLSRGRWHTHNPLQPALQKKWTHSGAATPGRCSSNMSFTSPEIETSCMKRPTTSSASRGA